MINRRQISSLFRTAAMPQHGSSYPCDCSAPLSAVSDMYSGEGVWSLRKLGSWRTAHADPRSRRRISWNRNRIASLGLNRWTKRMACTMAHSSYRILYRMAELNRHIPSEMIDSRRLISSSRRFLVMLTNQCWMGRSLLRSTRTITPSTGSYSGCESE